jgi:hypothetical protein
MSMLRISLVLSIALVALVLPASASANVEELYRDLAARRLSPAPLVPTTVPRELEPIGSSIQVLRNIRRSAYGIRLEADRAVIALRGGEYTTVKAGIRDLRRIGTRVRSTRVRGRRGNLLTERTSRTLIWSEGGRVYWIGTGTPRTISLSELQATATGLDPLGGVFSGSDALGENDATIVSTRRTITADVSFTGACTAADGSPTSQRAGGASVTLLPRRGDAFSFDIAPNLTGTRPQPWQGTVSGTIGANGGSVEIRGTLSDAGDTCDTGAVSIPVRPVR